MRRTRLLIVVPAATAAVFAGVSPAAANDGHHDIKASVDDIGDRAEADDDKVKVSFKYSCDDGKKDDIRAEVKLEQDHSRYDASVKLDCDVDDKWVSVWLEEDENDLDNGKAKVTVTLYDNGRELDSESEHVRVSGADRDNDRDRHHDGDRDRHHDGDRDHDRDHHDRDHHDRDHDKHHAHK
jgi:hypothetical protein